MSQQFQQVTPEQRRLIADTLGESAKNIMYQFTLDKAIEARRTGLRKAILDGLIPVVMAGGSPHRLTAGSLASILLRSAEQSGLNAKELFEYAAQFSVHDRAAEEIRGFPSWPENMHSMERFGMKEIETPAGIVYVHVTKLMGPPTWWDRLLGRRVHTRRTMRAD